MNTLQIMHMRIRGAGRALIGTSLALTMLAMPGAGADTQALDEADLAAALEVEEQILDNMWFGQILEIDYAAGQPRTRENIVHAGAFGDSALWTGTYLAAESYRYATAEAKIDEGVDVGLWTGQRDDALERIEQMVKKFHLLINISKNWQHDFELTTEPPGFGGGVFPSEPGLLFRACVPTDAPSFATWSEPRGRRVFGPIPWDDGKEYWCEDGTSRDAYAGTTFGLLTAFDLVSPDVPWMRAMIRNDIMAMTAFTLKYAWTTPRPHGRISLPAEDLEDVTPPQYDIWGHDFENFISPLFVYVPMARLNMAQGARHVAREAGTLHQTAFWEAVWQEELATQGPILALSMEIDSVEPNSGYYKYNLHHLTGFSVIRLEEDPAVAEVFRQAFSVMDHTTGDDVNAHFETITYALTGEADRRDQAITHLREWLDYRARIRLGGWTTNSTRCEVDVVCVPRDRLEVVIRDADGAEAAAIPFFPGTSTGLRAARPLPVADRPPTDFLWQRPPTQLDGFEPETHQAPGIDYLLPYWMLRYHTDVAPPAAAPFPPWVGPAHA